MEEFLNNKKYQAVVETARTLFWKHGIRRISIEEICKEAGVSKMTFYRFFKNKNELAEQILKNIFEDAMQRYRAIMDQAIPFPEKINQTIVLKHDASMDISQEFLKDVYQGEVSSLKDVMLKYKEASTLEIVNDLKNAQKEGWIRKDIKMEFILYMMNAISENLFDEKLTSIYTDKHDLIMELTNFFFYGISKNE
ncbi:MAG: TetR/AcrR family transcriptional regulator [Bacteroidales bacterium]|nr:TetR/AcrR family transcriptional regulator [Bacteroidales bacterium]